MNKWKTARHWHNWGGLILALPLIIIGLTAVFIAHDKALGTRQVVISEPGKPQMSEVKAVAVLPDGSTLLGLKYGLWQVRAGEAPRVLLDKVEVRDILPDHGKVWLAAKEGIWLGEAGSYRRIATAEVWQVSMAAPGRLLLASKDGGVQQLDVASLSLQAHPASRAALQQLPATAEPYTLNKLVMELHTGKFFFGKSGEWLWIDVLGIALVLLGLTGSWMWARSRRQR